MNSRLWPARLLLWVFNLLYHEFAWSYDTVAWLVSSGRWRGWTKAALDQLGPMKDGLVIEFGFGPGHLQLEMSKRGTLCVGIDESRQMGKIALARIKNSKNRRLHHRLIRGRAEKLPIASGVANAILATFPAEYIFQDQTLDNCRRVLRENGKIIFLMGVEPGGFSLISILLRFFYRLSNLEFQNLLGPQDYLQRIRSFGISVEPISIVYKKDRLWLIYGHKV